MIVLLLVVCLPVFLIRLPNKWATACPEALKASCIRHDAFQVQTIAAAIIPGNLHEYRAALYYVQ